MRLAFFSSSFPPYTSGVGVNAATITSGLAEKGHRVNVFIPGYPLREVRNHPLVSPKLSFTPLPSIKNPFKKSHLLLLPGHKSLIRNLTSFNPEVIHLQEPQFHLFPAVNNYCRIHRIPLVCAHHFPPEFITNQLPGFLRFKSLNDLIIYSVVNLYNRSRHVITPTRAMAGLLRGHGLKIPLSVISNGVDTTRFLPRNIAARDSQLLPRRYVAGNVNPPQSRIKSLSGLPVILYLGRLDFDKNLDTLISAAGFIHTPCEIWFAGSGKAEKHLKSGSQKSTVRTNIDIKFLGYVPENKKPDIYRQATIFVMPSTAEAQSIVSLEAAACGLPLIVADAAALPELIDTKNPNGLLFTPKNPEDLAGKIDALLSQPEKLAQFSLNSRRLAETHDIRKVIDLYENTYLSLL